MTRKSPGAIVFVLAATLLLTCYTRLSKEDNALRQLQIVTDDSATERKVMWLLTYPGSGEDHIKHMVHEMSESSMATNYGYDVYPNPSIGDGINGPFQIRADLSLPAGDILTESHCAGYCLRCGKSLADGDWRQFYIRCASGNYLDMGVVNINRYKSEKIEKLVHLVRDPFDTLIERFYLDHEEQKDANDGHWKYSMDREGFKQWCTDFDNRMQEENGEWFLHHIPQGTGGVPCQLLFYQYILWHNNVAEVMGSLGWRMEEFHVHYEEVISDTNVLLEFFTFLGLPIVSKIPSPPGPKFISADFFLENERVAISSLMKVIARRDVWGLVEEYLPEPKMEDVYSPIGSHLSPETYGSWPELAWLLSFPKSGTDFTLRAVEKLSRTTTATNYASDTGDNYHLYPNVAYTTAGPYRRIDRPFPANYILTKSSCEVCTYCDPKRKISYDQFIEGCSRTKSISNVLGQYDPDLIKKIVHIVRSPFDTIVFTFQERYQSAMDHFDKRFQKKYPYSPEGFRKWCDSLDNNFNQQEPAFTGVLADVAKQIPCYGIFFQFIQWHNHAHEVRKRMNVPSTLVYYEDYRSQTEKTLTKLFNFVEIPVPTNIEETLLTDEFLAASILAPSPDDYFTKEEVDAVGHFVKALATEVSYQTLGRYF